MVWELLCISFFFSLLILIMGVSEDDDDTKMRMEKAAWIAFQCGEDATARCSPQGKPCDHGLVYQ